MILCPKCKERTNVYDSRISFEGTTRRKRICPGCAHRFATIEILDRGRPLEARKPAAPKPTKEKLARPVKKVETKRQPTEKVRRFDEEDDRYEGSTLDEDFAAVARELGIGGMNEY
jgi:transcriptional regulator NrdR family protein